MIDSTPRFFIFCYYSIFILLDVGLVKNSNNTPWCHYCDFFKGSSSAGLFKFTSYIKPVEVITDEQQRMLNRPVVIEAYFFFIALVK